ncbi:type III-B CRISPR module RAMP protein Cmr4 [Clostridium tetani]|uniref:type III-B CRISPR module RAMP protein Cmr4 n=1 Tax=Clostridium tetani TaxID=1513 RepID=UPI0024A7E6EC|nr:type III-B CRISPR module RAMP protein Cmr4 [Clostridium tetani]
MNNFKLYKIRCLTNMHVGNGDTSYTLIDNKVQRDVITNFPVINSSSLKGSLKNFLSNEKIEDEKIKYIFGHEENGIGNYKIFSGMLLSIPVRSNKKPFFRATCLRIIKDFMDLIENFNYELDIKEDLKKIIKFVEKNESYIYIFKEFNNDIKSDNGLRVEGEYANLLEGLDIKNKKNIEEIFGQDLIIIDDEVFGTLLKELPIIARNKLDNGESENLWYEEIVPRETIFYFGVIEGKNHSEEFNRITKEPIQIGGHATIGYGFCNISLISKESR